MGAPGSGILDETYSGIIRWVLNSLQRQRIVDAIRKGVSMYEICMNRPVCQRFGIIPLLLLERATSQCLLAVVMPLSRQRVSQSQNWGDSQAEIQITG